MRLQEASMQKVVAFVGVCLVVALVSAGVAKAVEEVTLHGTLMCAKCILKKADAKECQDVLVTKDDAELAAQLIADQQ